MMENNRDSAETVTDGTIQERHYRTQAILPLTSAGSKSSSSQALREFVDIVPEPLLTIAKMLREEKARKTRQKQQWGSGRRQAEGFSVRESCKPPGWQDLEITKLKRHCKKSSHFLPRLQSERAAFRLSTMMFLTISLRTSVITEGTGCADTILRLGRPQCTVGQSPSPVLFKNCTLNLSCAQTQIQIPAK